MGSFKDFKLYLLDHSIFVRKTTRFLKRMQKEMRRPRLVSIELTNACNADCIMCSRRYMTRKVNHMPLELAKHVIRPSAGPGGVTLKAPDTETILDYVAAADGFETVVEDGRIWAFRLGTPELDQFRKTGEPAKCVIRPSAGPMGMTVKAPDAETMDAYLRVAVR